MVRRGRTSIVREVKESLAMIDKIGYSKRDAKKAGNSGIHSTKQMANTMSDCQNFVKWCRSEYEVKSIADLKELHYKKYLQYLSEKGISQGHRINVETSLKLLEKGFFKRVERISGALTEFTVFSPDERIEKREGVENIKNRAYSEEEIDLIKNNVSAEVLKSVELMVNLGLRVKEAANIRAEHFIKSHKGWHVSIMKGVGITKGGRFREINIDHSFDSKLESLLNGKNMNETLVNVSVSTIRDGVNVACKKAGISQDNRGCHGFRHYYARNKANELMSIEQKLMMHRILDNRKIGRRANYGILSVNDREIYEEVKGIMNRIHEELGHGENRWELAMRYLSE